MIFETQNRYSVIKEAQDIFLDTFPLMEIDNEDVQLICKSYRNENSTLDSCRTLFKKHDDYFYNWAYVNYFDKLFCEEIEK
jgi:hypothetical protein